MKKCSAYKYCGGCQYEGVDYDQQLKIKQDNINKLLSCFGKVNNIIGMKDPYYYRNKIQINFAYDEHHNIVSGYYIPSTHTIVPVEECLISDRKINEIISSIKRIISKYKISIFDENRMKGCLRHILIRSSNLGEYMVVLVTGSAKIVKEKELINDILKYNPEVKTIIQNVNSRHTSMVLGPKNTTLYGKGYITDELCGLRFRISPSSFYQVNKTQTEVLYNEAINLVNLKKEETVLDAYCGTGTIGLSLSNKVKKVIGVELNRSAIRDALTNMKINGINNCEFVCDDAGRYMEYLNKNNTHIDTVIMDPPRAGSDMKFMNSLVRIRPDKVVYISCNPVTLKDNLMYLKKFYNIKKIQPVDMFPFTQHVETVVLLSRANK